MIRYRDSASGAWEDHLRSVNEGRQIEACRTRLLSCGYRSLFEDLGPGEYREMWQGSYAAQESAPAPDIEELRLRVLESAGEEVIYISRGEEDLLKRMFVNGWSMAADSWEQLPAIESLLKRLWCVLRFSDEDNTAEVTLVPELRPVLTEGLKNARIPLMRDALFRLGAMMHSIRYIYGFVFPCPLLDQFRAEIEKREIVFDKVLTERYIKAEFDYMFTPDGQLFLPHPALAFPERFLSGSSMTEAGVTEINFQNMLGGMGGILPEEVPSVTCFKGTVAGGIRPENDLNQTVDDLRYMAKQGAALEDMVRILKSACTVLPSQRMIDALERMRQEAVLWTGSLSAVLN